MRIHDPESRLHSISHVPENLRHSARFLQLDSNMHMTISLSKYDGSPAEFLQAIQSGHVQFIQLNERRQGDRTSLFSLAIVPRARHFERVGMLSTEFDMLEIRSILLG
jgi:hypothetical protein